MIKKSPIASEIRKISALEKKMKKLNTSYWVEINNLWLWFLITVVIPNLITKFSSFISVGNLNQFDYRPYKWYLFSDNFERSWNWWRFFDIIFALSILFYQRLIIITKNLNSESSNMSPSSKSTNLSENEDLSPNKENYETNRPKLLKKSIATVLPPSKNERFSHIRKSSCART